MMYAITLGTKGIVYETDSEAAARAMYGLYVKRSKELGSACTGQPVTLLCDGQPVDEHQPPQRPQRQRRFPKA